MKHADKYRRILVDQGNWDKDHLGYGKARIMWRLSALLVENTLKI